MGMLEIKEPITIITAKEASEVYGCTRSRIQRFIERGRLTPLIREGKVTIFDKVEVERLRDGNLPARRKMEQAVADAKTRREVKSWATEPISS